jgi:hypothetical protein
MGEVRRYRFKIFYRIIYVIFGVVMIGASIALALASVSGEMNTPWVFQLVSMVLVAFGIYLGGSGLFSYVQLDADSVSMHNVFFTRSLLKEKIKGFRTVSSRNGTYMVIEGKDPEDKRVTIANAYNLDDKWDSWVATLVDLDQQDRQAVLDSIAGANDLGDTPEERMKALSQAKPIAYTLIAVTVAAAASLWFFREAINMTAFRAISVLLAVLPLVAVWLQARSPLLYAFLAPRKDPRPDLSIVVMAAGFGLIAKPYDNLQTMHMSTLLLYGGLCGALITYAHYRISSTPGRRQGAWIALLIYGCLYGFGLVSQANVQFDSSPAMGYSTQILKKTYTTGRSSTYYLWLQPWGQGAQTDSYVKASVSSLLYHNARVGDAMCVTAHDGALKVAWYTVQPCDANQVR